MTVTGHPSVKQGLIFFTGILQLHGAILHSQAAGIGCQNWCTVVTSNQHFCLVDVDKMRNKMLKELILCIYIISFSFSYVCYIVT